MSLQIVQGFLTALSLLVIVEALRSKHRGFAGLAAARAQTSRKHGLGKFMKLASDYMWRALADRFR